MRNLTFSIVLFLLFSCSGGNGECVIYDTAFVPIIKAKIENKSYYFIIDTGASISVVDYSRFRKEFPKKRIGKLEEKHVTGYGGKVKGLHSISLKLSSGTLEFSRDWKVKDISDIVTAVRNRTGREIFGIIGSNNLRGKVIDLDGKRIYYKKQE